MKYNKIDDKIFVTIAKDELINKNLLEVAKREKAQSAWINGIGAITDVEIGYYDLDQKTYVKKEFNSDYELISLMGNISLVNNKPFIHTHISFSDTNYKTFGGHLFDAKILVAGEFFMHLSEKPIYRELNCDIGLALWNI